MKDLKIRKMKARKRKMLRNVQRYARPPWAIAQNVRLSGLVEDICHHGVGHPNAQWIAEHPGSDITVHGCDRCCSTKKS